MAVQAINPSPSEGFAPSSSGMSTPGVSGSVGKQLQAFDKVQKDIDKEFDKLQSDPFGGNLTSFLKQKWERARVAKEEIGDILNDNLRQRNSEYGATTSSEIDRVGGSKDFMPLTSEKCRALLAWLTDVLMTTGQKTWSLRPTTMPDLPEAAIGQIVQTVMYEVMEGYYPQDDAKEWGGRYAEKLQEDMKNEAREKARRMEEVITDQMEEGDWAEEFAKFLDDFVTYPTAIMAGPFLRPHKSLKWVDNQPIVEKVIRLTFERVSPHDFFPGPSMVHCQHNYFFHSVPTDMGYLQELRGVEGFNSPMINAVLQGRQKSGSVGMDGNQQERENLEDRNQQQGSDDDDQIRILKYFGQARGEDIVKWGKSSKGIADPNRLYEVEAWLVDDFVIRAVLNPDPLGRRPYSATSYEKKPGSFWGFSVPDRISNIQGIVNATCRSLMNNLAISAGPQIMVDKEQLAEGQEINYHQAFRVWMLRGGPLSSSAGRRQPIEFYQPANNANSLMGVFQYFKEQADDASGIPRYVQGNSEIGGAGQTASGLSMLLGASARGVKLAIHNIDQDVIQEMVMRCFEFNMLHNPDQQIKGDIMIVPIGALELINRDNLQVRRQEFADRTANPVDFEIMGKKGRAHILRSLSQGLEFTTDVIPDEQELLEQELIAQQQMMMAQVDESQQEGAPSQANTPQQAQGVV